MAKRWNGKDLAYNLPDAYRKDPDSNNSKILAIEKKSMDALRNDIKDVDSSLDLELAYGYTLDVYGERVGQARGLATDPIYRILIKSKIARNMVNGDYDSIINALSLIFGCDPSQFVLQELDQPCVVDLIGIPIAAVNRLGLGEIHVFQIVKAMLPAGVRLGSLVLEGTFEFSDSATDYDEDKGFADVAQTVGGTFGKVAGGIDIDLPI